VKISANQRISGIYCTSPIKRSVDQDRANLHYEQPTVGW